jgi:hypothetical protein
MATHEAGWVPRRVQRHDATVHWLPATEAGLGFRSTLLAQWHFVTAVVLLDEELLVRKWFFTLYAHEASFVPLRVQSREDHARNGLLALDTFGLGTTSFMSLLPFNNSKIHLRNW